MGENTRRAAAAALFISSCPPLSTEVQVTGFMGKGTFILWPIIRSAGRTRCTIQHFLHVMFCILNTNQLRLQIVLQIFFFLIFWKKWMNLKALCLHQSHRHYSCVGVGILFVLFPPPTPCPLACSNQLPCTATMLSTNQTWQQYTFP